MSDRIYTDVNRRHDFVLLFDVTDGNPNGDPDAGNLPRVDPETMQGMVTDVGLKRKVRNYVDLTRGDQGRFKIYVQNKGMALNTLHQRAYDDTKIKSTGSKQKRSEIDKVNQWMCENFYDIRTFGAVMTTGVNCGQVRGPMQLTLARSIDPVVPLDVSITRVAVTRAEEADFAEGKEGEEGTGKQTEMGRKSLLPYGLYRGYGFFNTFFARPSGFSEEDFSLFWEALEKTWDRDRSASRGFMAGRGLYVFSHQSEVGDAPAHVLFERVSVRGKDGVEAPRSFHDYDVNVNDKELPEGVKLTRLV